MTFYNPIPPPFLSHLPKPPSFDSNPPRETPKMPKAHKKASQSTNILTHILSEIHEPDTLIILCLIFFLSQQEEKKLSICLLLLLLDTN